MDTLGTVDSIPPMTTATAQATVVEAPTPPVRTREVLSLLGFVILADVTIYRGYGYSGLAAFLAGVSTLLLWGTPGQQRERRQGILLALVAGLVVRAVWCGNPGIVLCGLWLLSALALSLAGRIPYAFDVVAAALQALGGLKHSLQPYEHCVRQLVLRHPAGSEARFAWAATVLIPAAVVLVFGTLFTLANPDLLRWISSELKTLVQQFFEWCSQFTRAPAEIAFLCCSIFCGACLLRPSLRMPETAWNQAEAAPAAESLPQRSPWYEIARNTLLAVVALFGAYLGFEFVTLWGRVFPKGFHYSGYAHEGAAWLTVALALATLTLSVIFKGAILHDPRLKTLRLWGAIWTVQNLILAVAVFHRMQIYVGFNGMTRMRVIGILGISAVVCGLCLVIWKIARNRSFGWLLQRQLWAVSGAFYLYTVLPVDAWVMQYNVRRILQGDSAPCVQISVHRTSDEGWLQLLPLLDAPDAEVRAGLRALLSRMQAQQVQNRGRWRSGWTRSQVAEELLDQRLSALPAERLEFVDQTSRDAAIARFASYAYQWY